MSILHSLLLGAIEGITEFLPISSTAHLLLTEKLLALQSTDFLKTFDVVIQLGAILAVVVLYLKKILASMDASLKILAAFIPTAIIAFALHKFIKNVLFESTHTILAAMFLGGIILVIFEQLHKEKHDAAKSIDEISYKQAVIIGAAQAVAVIPGVSRAAATIVGGLLLGVSRSAIVEFSFLLAVPTMLAATVLDLSKGAVSFSSNDWELLAIGFATAFITALIAIRWLLRFIQHHSFTAFGIYRIAIAVVLFSMLA